MDQGDEVNIEKTVVAIVNLLSSYSLDAKLVLSLAALATEFGDFWRLRKDLTHKSSLPKEFCLSMAILKFESGYLVEPKKQPVVDELNNLIMLILEVTKSISELEKLRNNYTSANVPGLLPTIQKHVYGTIAKQIEVYWKLVSILRNPYHESSHEVVDILKMLISTENDPHLLHINDGSTTVDDDFVIKLVNQGVSIDVLSKKDVLLLISSLDISNVDIKNLQKIYEGIKGYKHYKMVWIPVMEQWTPERLDLFIQLRDQMPWYTVQMFSSPVAGIKFIKEEWHFNGQPVVVLLNQQGEVENPNALPLIRLRGMDAFPFAKVAEDAIRNLDNWLHLVANHIHLSMQSWIEEEKYIFFYGGTDQHWIKKLQGYIKSIDLGKFLNDGEDEGNNTIESVEVGESEIRFWTNIESLQFIKEDDETHRVLQRLISNKKENGWAILVKGSTVIISDQSSKISRALKKLVIKLQSEEENNFHEENFETIFKEYHKQVAGMFSHSCQINIPSSAANIIPKNMKCLECGQVMETFISFRWNKSLTTNTQNSSADFVRIKPRNFNACYPSYPRYPAYPAYPAYPRYP
ncbi:protein SIEVE ELEMENT OCCLUSION B [Ziziphus jujuba]|uniref:Protein SIEVE ELEMENT OCCLUSION B n=1 Tax=Ziziphus jujuba TaxID=326968 RepID=A0ABM4AC72_ZIZJJ|nr:protein SIEVE ELEMENT OCCLUSION B [Ziziphus jujuba]